jgi:hypothetical protein
MLNFVKIKSENGKIKNIEQIGIDQFRLTYDNGSQEMIRHPFSVGVEKGVNGWYWRVDTPFIVYFP